MTNDVYQYIKELESCEIEFIDKDDNIRMLNTYIKEVFQDYILIAPPEKDEVSYEVPDNAEVNLIFAKDNKFFVASCIVMGKELGVKSGVKLSLPYNSKVIERREYIRIPLRVEMEVTCLLDTEGKDNYSFSVQSRDISGSGISFYHKEPLENYYDINCKINLNDGNPNPVFARCDLVYTKPVTLNEKEYLLTALTFTSLSDDDCSRIVKECFKFQVDRKKHLVE